MNDDQRQLINAFNDGQLDELQEENVKRILARDPEARAYLEELAGLDDLLQSTFNPISREPVPPRLYPLLKRRRRSGFSHRFVPMALAAGLLLAAVVIYRQEVVDRQMREQLLQMGQDIAALRHRALENVPSGEVVSWTAPVGLTRAEVMPLKTYRTSDSRFCREYEERIEDADGIEIRRGVACRAGKEHWPDLTQVPSAAARDPAENGGGGFRM
jgi:surface antigen